MEAQRRAFAPEAIEEVTINNSSTKENTRELLERIQNGATCRCLNIYILGERNKDRGLARLLADTVRSASIERVLLSTAEPDSMLRRMRFAPPMRHFSQAGHAFLQLIASGIGASNTICEVTLIGGFDAFYNALPGIRKCTSLTDLKVDWRDPGMPPSGPIFQLQKCIQINQLKILRLAPRFQSCIPIIAACRENTSIEHYEFVNGNEYSRQLLREKLCPWAEQNRQLRLYKLALVDPFDGMTDKRSRLYEFLSALQENERPLSMSYDYLRRNMDTVSSLAPNDRASADTASKKRKR